MGKNRKSGGSGSGGGNTEPSPYPERFTEKEWESVKTIEDIAALTGYTITQDKEGNVTITDAEHDTVIKIDKYYTKGAGRRNINMANDGTQHKDILPDGKYGWMKMETYDFKDIVRAYQEAPQILKDGTHQIILSGKGFKSGHGGYHRGIGGENGVVIQPDAFGKKDGDFSFRKVLYHELGHGYDYSIKSTFGGYDGITTSKNNYGISLGSSGDSPFYKAAMSKPCTAYVKDVEQVYGVGSDRYLKESLAEAVGIVATYNSGVTDFKVDVGTWNPPNPNPIPAKQWISENKDMVKEANKIINGDYAKGQFSKTDVGTLPEILLLD